MDNDRHRQIRIIMDSRDEEGIRKIYPDAEFMPWDDPPIGQRVTKAAVPGSPPEIGTVVGNVQERESPANHCPSCTCVKDNIFYLWWKVRWEGWWGYPGKGYRKYAPEEKHPDDTQGMESLEWPPNLRRVGGKSE